ncbi:cyclodeaminase [Vibrio proteolyticus]|uniref:Ornithine cyclodeaminase/mu-crystallin family protein n=1 Tax=Vibrio proteolyticus NBRC 13287 TaxID=1219065 RepID=U3BFT6_VIBPR|nr:cyclodeaminase [Vibrio proteolyticus]GAD68564.1 ornithine cyclodeaminase/mu-crystallin family protein [Vibrio proteolyticus NBRC 13287]
MEIYNKTQIQSVTGLNEDALLAVEDGFRALGEGRVTLPPILSMTIAESHGEVDVKTAHIEGIARFAIKISPGFFDNPKLGLPSLNGLMVLLSAKTGLVDCVLFDEGYLTDVRTALAGAISAKYLSNPDAKRVAVIGAGLQAELQVAAMTLVRDIKHVDVWARDADKAYKYQRRMAQTYDLPVTVHSTIAEACCEADIIVTTTPSREALLYWRDIPAGAHVIAMGSDSPHKRELADDVLLNADHLVVDRLSQSESVGELRCMAKPLPRKVCELGEIICGVSPYIRHVAEISVCDLTGTGVQDTAIANYTAQRLAGDVAT